MAGKRSASSDLNHTNWDQDEEPEDSGTFKKAAEETIKSRVIKTARRRNPISSSTESGIDKKSVFGGFSFGKSGTTTPSFGFLKNTTAEQPKVNGIDEKVNDTEAENKGMNTSERNATGQFNTEKNNSGDKTNEYFARLKGLNESVASWIKTHVDVNPFVNLAPIFRDYEAYLVEIETKSEQLKEPTLSAFKTNESNTGTSVLKSDTEHSLNTIYFKPSEPGTSTVSKPSTPSLVQSNFVPTTKSSPFLLPQKADEAKNTKFPLSSPFAGASTSSSFNFGSTNVQNVSSTTGASFSFGSGKPFSFTNVSKPVETVGSKQEDEEDEPPKAEFTPVVEEGHIYTVRCKVFVKKDNRFGDHGVGNLYLKPVPSSEKVQLVVRADTNLGNLLCNFILSESIPTQRMGKKDVMLVCLPTPESKPPPTPMLLRVKSTEEADELLKVLERHKK